MRISGKQLRLAVSALALLVILTPITPVLAAEDAAPVQDSGDSPATTVNLPAPEAPQETEVDNNKSNDPSPDLGVEKPPLPDEEKGIKKDPGEDAEKDQPQSQPQSLLFGQEPQPSNLPVSTIKQFLPRSDELTGSLVYSFPIVIPPGRNGMQPDLSLGYTTQSANEEGSIFGTGWSSNIPFIERINKTGVEDLYSQTYFRSSMDGELISLGSGNYGAKVDNGNFLKYSLSGNVWTVTDKEGKVYKFGTSASERQDDPSDSSHIYKWMIQEARDLNDNYIEYSYYKNQGQIYPSSITYTGHGSTDGIFEIAFSRESRSDDAAENQVGFSVVTAYRINEIQIKVSGSWTKKYTIAYTTGSDGNRSLIDTIIESGRDDGGTTTTLPATDFNYQVHDTDWTRNDNWEFPLDYHDTPYGVDYPPAFSDIRGRDEGVQLEDVNGDALPDLVQAGPDRMGGIKAAIYINNGTGTGWTEDDNYVWPTEVVGGNTVPIQFVSGDGYDQGVRMADLDGDGYSDIIQATIYFNGSTYIGKYHVWINNADGTGWTEDTNWVLPPDALIGSGYKLTFSNSDNGYDYGTRIADINGDGLADLLRSINIDEDMSSGHTVEVVYLNKGDGTGWDQDTDWVFPHDYTDTRSGWNIDYHIAFVSNNFDKGVRIADLNGDGLADLIRGRWEGTGSSVTQWNNVYINKGDGTGWAEDPNWVFPVDYVNSGVTYKLAFINAGTKDSGLRIADVNGDGLPDLLRSRWQEAGPGIHEYNDVFINNGDGTGWDQNPNWSFPVDHTDSGVTYHLAFVDDSFKDQGVRVADVDGDGMADLVQSSFSGDEYAPDIKAHVYTNNGPRVDLMSQITYPEGGTTNISYKTTPLYADSGTLLNPNLPYALDTVYQITNSDGAGTSSVYTYQYEGGKFYFNGSLDRKVSGFSKITRTDSAGNKVITYYHQGDTTNSSQGEYSDDISKAGKTYRVEITDSSGNLYSKTISKWENYDLGDGRDFVKLTRDTQFSYDGDSDHREKSKTYTYDDATGNLTESVDWGEVSGSNDGTFTDSGTDDFTTAYSYATDGAYNIGLPSDVSVTDHSSAKVKQDRYYYDSQSLGTATLGNQTKHESWKTGSTYINTQKTYDGTYGIVTADIDPRGKTTSYSYDSYHLYPATVTNPLSQATYFTYDYSSGQIKQKVDSNTRVFQSVFDGLDRVIQEKQPDLTSPTTLVVKTAYAYTDTSGSVSVHKTDNLDSSVARETYQYFDGFHRLLQQRVEAEGSNYEVTDTKYNNIEQLDKQSAPYFSSGTSKTSPTTTTSLYTSYTYDPMLRVATSVTPVGTITNTYDDWKLTINDARGKNKDLYKDAYGNLIQVDEHDSSSTYSTYYIYDYLGDLTNLTDALGNVRNFTYDGLGRRLTAEDLHATADTTYGSWTYTYDDAGNLTETVDPKSQTIDYTYDNINRQLTENYTGHAGTEVTYTYDSGTNGKGHLTGITSAPIIQTNTYNPVGGLKSESQLYGFSTYLTTYDYDRQGNQTLITNPDSSNVKYLYNSAGLLESVQRKESGALMYANVVTNFDYSPTDQPTTISYQNGATTTNTYDATALYRMSAKVTTIAASAHAQDLAYTYDANGNVTQIIDASATSTSKTANYVYDDLNRLTSATITSVASGQSPYTENYTYDAIGNIASKTGVGTYTYGGSSGTNYANPHAVTATSTGSLTYTYDANGNQLTDGSTLTNTWDYKNRMTQSVVGGVTTYYYYDPSGQRIIYGNGTTLTYYATPSYNTDGTTARKHIFANGIDIAVVNGTGGSAVVNYIHTDHLTGSNILTDSADTTYETLDYFPFGTARIDTHMAALDDQRKFADSEYDSTTSLNYMKARYYDANLGRFTSEDPAFLAVGDTSLQAITKLELTEYLKNPQQLNSYSYVANNPLKYVDPNGQFLSIITDIAFIAYDLHDLSKTMSNHGNVLNSAIFLGIDVVSAAIPGVPTGASELLRGADVAVHAAEGVKDATQIGEKLTSNQIGKIGEQKLAEIVGSGTEHAPFNTSQGKRYVDRLTDTGIHESKNGYVTATKGNLLQASKDAEISQKTGLMPTWHLFQGGSRNLMDSLAGMGIKVIDYSK